jgi:hypothetical protein
LLRLDDELLRVELLLRLELRLEPDSRYVPRLDSPPLEALFTLVRVLLGRV